MPSMCLMILNSLLALGVFAVDLVLPLGVIDGIAYVPVVLVSLWSPRRWYPYTVALACSALAILGFFASPPGNPVLWMAGLNRLFALVAIWTTAILGRWRQRVEASRQEGDVRLRAIIETAVDGIITIDQDGIIESFNAAAERLFGYTAADVIGRNVSLLMPAPYREEHDGYLARYLRTGEKKSSASAGKWWDSARMARSSRWRWP